MEIIVPALNFKEQFQGMVANGSKRSTIRKERKIPIKKGDILHLKVGMRTKNCRALGTHTCKSVDTIHITIDKTIRINNKILWPAGRAQLALSDGFSNIWEFFNFFELQYSLPFKGVLIKW